MKTDAIAKGWNERKPRPPLRDYDALVAAFRWDAARERLLGPPPHRPSISLPSPSVVTRTANVGDLIEFIVAHSEAEI